MSTGMQRHIPLLKLNYLPMHAPCRQKEGRPGMCDNYAHQLRGSLGDSAVLQRCPVVETELFPAKEMCNVPQVRKGDDCVSHTAPRVLLIEFAFLLLGISKRSNTNHEHEHEHSARANRRTREECCQAFKAGSCDWVDVSLISTPEETKP
ncbi:hypothetical protein K445DRAFT_25246 [Daldinia sp. EC12]|nr:hypothetical protein F4774DRAFT_413525 [Daldinia eschscholtzii]OTB12827.1 hypothetical protein K445DRAFT_25246 [Daldinia sp. EC12]